MATVIMIASSAIIRMGAPNDANRNAGRRTLWRNSRRATSIALCMVVPLNNLNEDVVQAWNRQFKALDAHSFGRGNRGEYAVRRSVGRQVQHRLFFAVFMHVNLCNAR